MSSRPTTDPKIVVLDLLDDSWDTFERRLAGLTTVEFLWEPCPDAWSVRGAEGGSATVDGAFDREADPAPVTTIAWRLWHLAVDCFDSYSERLFGRTGASVAGPAWHVDVGPALADLDAAWRCFRSGIDERDTDEWWQELGEHWGPFARHSLYDLAQHAAHELIHHAAEVALLRDLYRVLEA